MDAKQLQDKIMYFLGVRTENLLAYDMLLDSLQKDFLNQPLISQECIDSVNKKS